MDQENRAERTGGEARPEAIARPWCEHAAPLLVSASGRVRHRGVVAAAIDDWEVEGVDVEI
jgi:hypothetical protein